MDTMDAKRTCLVLVSFVVSFLTLARAHSTVTPPSTDVPPTRRMEQAAASLKKTPLHARHLASGAKMVAYGGWDMPVEYSGIVAEHMAVRQRAGVFDRSEERRVGKECRL